MRKREGLVSLAAVALLAGCGGGDGAPAGGGGTPTPVATSSPAPTPAPSPTPTPASSNLPPAPFGLTASQDFALVGWAVPDPNASGLEERFQPFTPELARFRWSVTARTYELFLASSEPYRLVYTFPGSANRAAFTLLNPDGSDSDLRISLGLATAPIGIAGTQGAITITTNSTQRSLGVAAFGIPTPEGSLPASGLRRFTTTVVDEYSPLISYDLATGRISGTVRIAFEDAFGPYPPTSHALEDLVLPPRSTAFTAAFSVPGAPFKGRVLGRLMGPAGDQMAIAVLTPIQNIYTFEWEARTFTVNLFQCTQCS